MQMQEMRFLSPALLTILSLGAAVSSQTISAPSTPDAIPTPAHVIVVIEENHGYSQIIGSGQAPYINSLATQGALFTNSFAVAHPSEPNYLALFSGSTHGIIDDSCPHTFSGRSLESMLLTAGKTFKGYSEDLPRV